MSSQKTGRDSTWKPRRPTHEGGAAAGGARAGGADLETLNRVVERIRSNVKKVIEGKPDVISTVLIGLLAEGHILIEDVPGRRQDHAQQVARPQHRVHGAAHPVHARPAALGRDRRVDLQPEHPRVRVPARRRLRQHRGRRRDQPRLAQDPVRAAGVHGGAPGHRRQLDVLPGVAVHGHRDPEPHRDGGHLRPPRGPARPLHAAALDRLPGRGLRDRDARLPHAVATRSTTSSRSPTPPRSAS